MHYLYVTWTAEPQYRTLWGLQPVSALRFWHRRSSQCGQRSRWRVEYRSSPSGHRAETHRHPDLRWGNNLPLRLLSFHIFCETDILKSKLDKTAYHCNTGLSQYTHSELLITPIHTFYVVTVSELCWNVSLKDCFPECSHHTITMWPTQCI